MVKKIIYIGSIFSLLALFFFPYNNSHAASLWDDATTPTTASFNDSDPYELGVRFQSSQDGYITGLRFYKGTLNTGLHYGTLWTNAGTKLGDVVFTNETSSGWQQANFAKPIKISASTNYIASYYTGVGRYAFNANYFTSTYTNSPLSASTSNGLFRTPRHLSPNTVSGNAGNYWVDVVFETSVTPPSTSGSGPVLVITSTENNFTNYLSEILRGEGLNLFATADISNVDSTVLSNYDTVVLGEMPLSSSQATIFTNWVTSGGNLIAMRPDGDLASLLGLTSAGTTLDDGYLLVDTASSPGEGIVDETIQYHGTADRYTLNGATTVATLYSNASTVTSNPAVTIRSVGSNGGQAAAFMYDLAKSVIHTRQGNPAYEGVDRDGDGVIRSNDLYYPSYLDFTKVHIPQADEQQRLLANMIHFMGLDKKPLPRFWYLPNKKKAAFLYAIDEHGSSNGTEDSFNRLLSLSDSGCSVTEWECLRGTSWFYPAVSFTNAEAAAFYNQGFEMGVHAEGCDTCTPYTYNTTIASDLATFQGTYPSLPAQQTHRYHAIPWTDWNSHARIDLENDIRFDMNYYYYPPTWTGDNPGFMTGSGFPQKFGAIDGSVIDVYQQNTDFTNDNQLINNEANLEEVLDRALGNEGYYGIIGSHDDTRDTATLSAYLNALSGRDVPMISAYQAFTWIDGRHESSFTNFSWNNNALGFTITAASGADNMYAMLPTSSSDESLTSIKKSGTSVSYTTETIKGIEYAFFAAESGSYTAQYGQEATPTPTSASSTSSSTGSSSTSTASTTSSPGWKYAIQAGPNFAGIPTFISGSNDAAQAKIFIDNDASTMDVYLSLTKASGNDLMSALLFNPFPWMQGLNTVSEIFLFTAYSSFNGYPVTTFDKPVIIVLPYDPIKLKRLGILPEQLRIAWYDTTVTRWRVLENNTVVNKKNHTVINTTNKLSYFAVVYRKNAQAAVQGIQDIRIGKSEKNEKLTQQVTRSKQPEKGIKNSTKKEEVCLLFICW